MSTSFINNQIKKNKNSVYNKDGTMKDYILIDKEIVRLEEQRPKRYKRNGKEIENNNIEEFSKELDNLRNIRVNGNKSNKQIKLFKNSNKLNLEAFNSGCIYMLYNDNELVYIGETVCFISRLSQHIQEGKKEFDSFKIRYYIENDRCRKNTEKRMIKKFKPKYNLIHNPNNKK